MDSEPAANSQAEEPGGLSGENRTSEEILSAAEEAARAYYAETVLEVISMELKSLTEDTILFSVSVKKDGIVQEPERSITLQLILGTWEVVNEGY